MGVKKLKGENLKEEIKSGEYIAVSANNEHGMETAESGEQVHFVVAEGGEDGEHDGEGQTIVLGSEAAASLVDSNGQDMIVVIQSDDFDQSQGLIVVDPSQLQHMVTTTGAGGHLTGTTTTTTSNGEGEEMIFSDAHHGQGHNEYISLQMPDGSSQRGTLVLAHDGSENQGQEGYIVVTAEDAKGTFALQTTEASEALEQKVTIVQKSQDVVPHQEDPEQASG